MHKMHIEYMTVKEAAEILGKDGSTIRRYCDQGLFPGAKKAGLSPKSAWRIPTEAVHAAREQIVVDE